MGNAKNASKNVHAAGKVASSPASQPKPSSSQAKEHDRLLRQVESAHRKAFTSTERRG